MFLVLCNFCEYMNNDTRACDKGLEIEIEEPLQKCLIHGLCAEFENISPFGREILDLL